MWLTELHKYLTLFVALIGYSFGLLCAEQFERQPFIPPRGLSAASGSFPDYVFHVVMWLVSVDHNSY